jgi:hypothetical protein
MLMKKLVGGLVLAIVICLTFSTMTLAEGFAHFFKKGNVIGQTLYVPASYHLGASYQIQEFPPCPPPDPCTLPPPMVCPPPPPCPDPIMHPVQLYWVSRLVIRNTDTSPIQITAVEAYGPNGERIWNYDDVVNLFLPPLPDDPLIIGPRASTSIRISPSAFRQTGHSQDCDPPSPGCVDPDPRPFPQEGGRCHFIVKWESVDGKPALPPAVGAARVGYKFGYPIAPGMWVGWGPNQFAVDASEAIVIEEERYHPRRNRD